MWITMIQSKVQGTKEETLAHIENIFETHRACREADFVCLPEMFACPYENAQFPLYAEPEGGPTWQFCSDLAKKYGVILLAGTMPELAVGKFSHTSGRKETSLPERMASESSEQKIYNTAYVFDRAGRQIAKYRKMHLFDIDIKGGQSFRESDTLSAGDEAVVFDTEWGKMGICICYDIRFPELARILTDLGAKVIFCPAAFNTTTGPLHWELLFRQRAVDNQVFTVGISTARDAAAAYQAWGHSMICDPWGKVLVQMDEKEGVATAELDFSEVERVRTELPLLRHRRSEIYGKYSENGKNLCKMTGEKSDEHS